MKNTNNEATHKSSLKGHMTFKSAALMSMLSQRALPKLDELNDGRYFASSLTSKAGVNSQVHQKIPVTPKPIVHIVANWWVCFEDYYTQRQFSRRVDDFSFRFDVTSIVVMSLYVLCFAVFDIIYMLTLKKKTYSEAVYGFRIFARIFASLVLIFMSRWHWKKSIQRPRYVPWGTKWWVTRSNALVVDITIFYIALHIVNIFSGDVWSPTIQYRIFFELVIAISLRPVDKLQAIITIFVLGIFVPLIWLLITMNVPTDTCGGLVTLNWDPQAAILPVVAILVPFLVERLCHYRLLFMALEFVQWRRLQIEELECILKCGDVEYGVADRRVSDCLESGERGVGSGAVRGNASASDAVVNEDNEEDLESGILKTSMASGSPHSLYAIQSQKRDYPNHKKESRYVDALEQIDHTTSAEICIAHINRVLDQLDMPEKYQTLLRDAISIVRKGPSIFEPNIIEQLSRVVAGRKKKSHTSHNTQHSPTNGDGKVLAHQLVGPSGSEALKGDHRDRLVRTKTALNIFELDQSNQHLETLDIDTQEMMKSFNTASFNVFKYEKNPKQAFVAAGILVLNDHRMFQTFRLDEMTVLRALQRFAEIYNTPADVPYHSQLHGVDVAQLSHLYVLNLYKSSLGNKSREGCPLDATHRFALLFGALVHDLGHPGVNNSFLCETSSPMALRFNDIAVLESFHVSSTFQVLAKPKFNIFSQLEHDERSKIRSVIIELILATDLADHFKSLKSIQATLNVPSIDVLPHLKIGGSANQSVLGGYQLSKELTGVEQSELGKLILKAADIGHPARDPWVHQEWSRRASEEFWRQGDRERRLGLVVDPMNDRKLTKTLAKGQMGFLSFLVAPTHFTLRVVMGAPKLQHIYDNLKYNYQYWEREAKKSLENTNPKEVGTPEKTVRKENVESKVGRPQKIVYSSKKPPLPSHPPTMERVEEE
jgi:hypothetical protein